MNVFSSDGFLRTFADVYHPNADARISRFRVEEHVFRLLQVGTTTVTAAPVVDYWEPAGESPGESSGESAGDDHRDPIPLRSLARVALAVRPVESGAPDLDGKAPSPFVEVGQFTGFDDYQRMLHRRRPRLLHDSRRQRRRLEREAGVIEFKADDRDDAVLATCIGWNTARFRSSARLHRDPRPTELARRLRDSGVARVSSLRAGTTLVAADICLVHEGRVSGWIAAYDAAFGAFSPGRLLLEHLLEASFDARDREFDFLVGNEGYKWIYATHTRLVGPLGPQPKIPAAVMAVRKKLRLGRKYLRLKRTLRP